MYVPIAIGLMLALVAIGIAAMIGFGIKNIVHGKQELMKIGVYLVPALIFVITYLVLGAFTDAAIMTMLITIGLLALMLAVIGLRTTFKF